MGNMKHHADWSDVLSRLDRHGTSGRLSANVASLPELMETYRIPGISIAVAQPDGQLWVAGFGTTGPGRSSPVDGRTAFQACSISKHVAAYGTLRLVAAGALDLDADIHDYLTSWQLPVTGSQWRPRVTLRQLLAHTAGLSYNWFRGYHPDQPAPSVLQTLNGQAPAHTPPVIASMLPGSRFRYSGSHYAVLQQLIVDATGTPFEQLMRELVLDPVGMRDSSFDQEFPQRRPDAVARAHLQMGVPVPGGWHTVPELAGAGLWSTPTDLVTLEMEIARAAAGQSRLLDQDLAAQMLTPQVPGGYGLGTDVSTSAGYLRFGHGGGNVGYGCFSYAWPDAGAAVAVMANSDDVMEVLTAILAAAERLYATAPEPDESLTPDEVTGRYPLGDTYVIYVTAEDDQLILTATGQRSVVLLAQPDGRYALPGLDCEVEFQRANDGCVMKIRQERTTQTAVRTPATVAGGDGAAAVQ